MRDMISQRFSNGQDAPDLRAIDGLPLPPANARRMYAITFDLDTDTLQKVYPGDSWRNAHTEIRRILIEEGFDWQQGSVYFGNPEQIDAVTCVVASQRLASELSWFGESVRDIRMLRIEENNDLGPAIQEPPRRRR
jgi:virulence-associated protein VapD